MPTAASSRRPRGSNQETPWTTLAGYLAHAESHGISQNVASYIGHTTLRTIAAGYENRPLSAAEMANVQAIIRDEMNARALGIGASLIYPPAFFGDTAELIAMCSATAPFGGRYIAHMRNESLGLLDGIDELVRIAREAGVPAESYHLKAAGKPSWPLMPRAIERIEAARAEGLAVTADMYTYTAAPRASPTASRPGSTKVVSDRLYDRLADPSVRAEIRTAIESVHEGWENFLWSAGSAENILLLQFRNPALRHYQGKTLAEAAAGEGTDAIDTIMNLVARDRSRITTAYFLMSDENVELGLSQPWVSLGSDSASMASEGVFLEASTHPRAYGNFARLLGKYVREQKLISLPDAIRKMTNLPATNLSLGHRGRH